MVMFMNLLEDIIVSDITSVLTVNYKKHEKTYMNIRPWHGLAFSLGGEIVYTHNTKKIYLTENQIVFIPKNTTYEVQCTKPGSFAVIDFLTAEKLNSDEFISTEVKNTDIFQREFSVMHKLFLAGSNKYENLSILYRIFSLLISSYDSKKIPLPLSRALKYIDTNISCPELSNTLIAENTAISEVYLRKLFSNNLSMSVNQYIQNKRTENAKLFLTQTSMSITEIAEKCGYSCIYYFCNSFKRKTGHTPTQYRNDNTHSFI